MRSGETDQNGHFDDVVTAPPALPDAERGRIVIFSADVGAGHDGAARELARRLRERGFQTDCRNVLDVFPWQLGRLIKTTYREILDRTPWFYDLLFSVGLKMPGASAATRLLLAPVRERLHSLLPPDTRAVVSTYPLASQILGPLRRRGGLAVPVITCVIDFAPHPIWVAPGIDVHCVLHPTSAVEVGDLGASDVRLGGPLVSPEFQSGGVMTKGEARQRLGLPTRGRLALLVAGSWGVGDVATAAAEISRTRVAAPVVVCGRNGALHRRLREQRAGHVFGWVDEMPILLRAADVLVENAGGLTSHEAMACGLPVATYRPIPGHGKANAAAMTNMRLATWVRHRGSLGSTLADLMEGASGQRQRAAGMALFEYDAAAVVADVAKRAEPLPDRDVAPELRERRDDTC